MSFDKSLFKSTFEDLLFTNSEETDNTKKAENLLKMGWLLGQSSLALNHSNETTSAIHQENLQIYRAFVGKNLDNYKEECRQVIPKETKIGDIDINLNADEFEKYLNFPCSGEFLDCRNEKITNEDIQTLFESTPVQSVQGVKRLHPDAMTSEEQKSSKFQFRNVNDKHIISTFPEVPQVPLESIYTDSNRQLFDSFGTIRNQNRTNSTVTRTEFERNSIDYRAQAPSFQTNSLINANITKGPEKCDRTTLFQKNVLQNGQNSKQPPNQPLFSYDVNKKPLEMDPRNSFRTGREELVRQNLQKNCQNSNQPSNQLFSYGTSTKTLGTRRTVASKFVPPIRMEDDERSNNEESQSLQHIDPKMIELIRSEIMVGSTGVGWDEIGGLEYAKSTIQEAVIWPILRPDIFTGLRRPPRGVLLFGPPGTGKTLIGRCIAAQSQSTFFSISASSLTSKWIGDGEKMVRALFAVASVHQPAVIFIDEIDSLLCQRSDNEHESSRRLKTEFLVQLDGCKTSEDDRILIVGATNRPQELDEAARRRLTKRLYIPLPELDARIQILTLLLKKERNLISEGEIAEIGRLTDGFSGADMKTLCQEALMGPIRSIQVHQMESIHLNDVRLVDFSDFASALRRVRPSVSKDDLAQYEKWDSTFGSGVLK